MKVVIERTEYRGGLLKSSLHSFVQNHFGGDISLHHPSRGQDTCVGENLGRFEASFAEYYGETYGNVGLWAEFPLQNRGKLHKEFHP